MILISSYIYIFFQVMILISTCKGCTIQLIQNFIDRLFSPLKIINRFRSPDVTIIAEIIKATCFTQLRNSGILGPVNFKSCTEHSRGIGVFSVGNPQQSQTSTTNFSPVRGLLKTGIAILFALPCFLASSRSGGKAKGLYDFSFCK